MRARVAVLVAGACAVVLSGACRDAEDESSTRIRVLDSTYTQSWEPMEDTGTVYRIEVVSPLGADTIRNVIPPAPIVVGDTLVIGLVQVSEDSATPQRKIFRLRLGQHRVETSPIPEDVWASYQDILISPNGRYIAYVGEDTTPSNPGTYGTVRDLASREVVIKGPGNGGCDCDEDFNHARWFAPDSFEIAVPHTNSNSGWQRISGKASAQRIHVDTLRDEPDWH
ncbi:MAG: hypothetical protein ABI994_03670 [Gemmatimonadales bacterium]